MCYILQALNFQHVPLPKPPRYAPFLLECHKRTATHALWLLLFLLQLPAKCIYLLWGGISGYRNHRVGWPGHPFWSQSGLILKSLGLSGCPPNMEILHWPGKTTAKQHPNPKRSLARSGDVHSNQLLAVLSMNSAGSRAANLEQQFFKDLSCKLQGMSHERPKKTATVCIGEVVS